MDEDDAQFLYVIQYDDGLVKVGQTRNMHQRYKFHQYWGRLTGRTVTEVDIGLRYGSALPDERKLIAFCQERWPALEGHREYFIGADFDQVWQYMRVLDAAAQ
jgi:predicted GIY-YIG superfamily endonuclease